MWKYCNLRVRIIDSRRLGIHIQLPLIIFSLRRSRPYTTYRILYSSINNLCISTFTGSTSISNSNSKSIYNNKLQSMRNGQQ